MKSVDGQDIGLDGEVTDRQGGLPAWKRTLDLGLIVILSPGLLLLSLIAALVVKAGSPGPVVFRQRRVGYRGRQFTIFKFRTMHVNAGPRSHQDHTRELMNADVPMTKLDARRDPRVVPLGPLLRATGLDELPQLLNVLRGDMSLVGPRPCLPYEYELYEPWQRRRFEAVPGLTGLWQVSGKNRTTFNEMIRLDITYAERFSLWLDLKIILKTLPALTRQCLENAARRGQEPTASATSIAKSIQSYHL